MEEKGKRVFREKTLERISSPDQLNDYLHVTNPGIWAVLTAVIILLAGVFVWSCTGTLETKSPASMVVKNHVAEIVVKDDSVLEKGMVIKEASQEYYIASVSEETRIPSLSPGTPYDLDILFITYNLLYASINFCSIRELSGSSEKSANDSSTTSFIP